MIFWNVKVTGAHLRARGLVYDLEAEDGESFEVFPKPGSQLHMLLADALGNRTEFATVEFGSNDDRREWHATPA